MEPQGDFGLSAHYMTTGYALVGEVDRRLAPFMIPTGTAQTELAARVFDRFRGLYGIYSRSVTHKAKQAEEVKAAGGPKVADGIWYGLTLIMYNYSEFPQFL